MYDPHAKGVRDVGRSFTVLPGWGWVAPLTPSTAGYDPSPVTIAYRFPKSPPI